MNSNRLKLLYMTSTAIIIIVAGNAKESKLGTSLISYMEMKNIFQELGAEEAVALAAVDDTDMSNYKTKANQNLLYHFPLPESSNNYGRPIQYWPYYQQIRPLELQQEQYKHRPQYLPLPLSQLPQQQNSEEGDANNVDDAEPEEPISNPEIEISQNQKEEEKVEELDLVDVHFDYSEMDTIEGGTNDGEDFDEFMEMAE